MVPRKLEIGTIQSRLGKDWETLDIRPGGDYKANAWDVNMIFEARVFDQLYACMVLEHIPRFLQHPTLVSWNYILKPHGILEVIVPDMEYIAGLILGVHYEAGIRLAYGDQDYPENTHIWGFTDKTLCKSLREAGFQVLEEGKPAHTLYIKATKEGK